MELLLGSHVREYGSRVGCLTGFELESSGFHLRRLLFTPDDGMQVKPRPPAAIALVHDDGEIELRPPVEQPQPPIPNAVQLTKDTRVLQPGRPAGQLLGVELDPSTSSIVSLFIKHHWWSRRASVPAEGIDVSSPGEIRIAPSSGTRAA